MTLFEKIYWTLFVVAVLLAAVADIFDENEEVLWWVVPLVVQVVGAFGYLIVKFLLWIWGVSIDLFPSCPLL